MSLDKIFDEKELNYFKQNRDVVIKYVFGDNFNKFKDIEIDVCSIELLTILRELFAIKTYYEQNGICVEQYGSEHLWVLMDLILGVAVPSTQMAEIIAQINSYLFATNNIIREMKGEELLEVYDYNIESVKEQMDKLAEEKNA